MSSREYEAVLREVEAGGNNMEVFRILMVFKAVKIYKITEEEKS